MKALMCFLFLDSLFTKQGNRNLAFDCLPVGGTPCC